MSDTKEDIVARLRWAVENDPLVPEAGYDEELTEATNEIERLREALAYYAEDGHYDSGDVPGHVYVLDDHGDTARVALRLPPRHKHPPAAQVCTEARAFWDGED